MVLTYLGLELTTATDYYRIRLAIITLTRFMEHVAHVSPGADGGVRGGMSAEMHWAIGRWMEQPPVEWELWS